MEFNEFINIINGRLINKPSIFFYKICIDTRKIEVNDIFIPICFKEGNGNNYIKEAVKKGSSLVLIPKSYLNSTNILEEILEINKEVGIIEIDDGLEVLKRIAIHKRNNYKGKVIGITGSNGKTSTKELLSLVLSKKYKVFKSKENFNNILGLCMMMLELNDEEVAVFEMGMNHPGEISEMSKILKPHFGLITNIGTAHIGNLGSKENILKAKLEIIDGFNETGLLFINEDDEYLNKVDYKNVYKFTTLQYEINSNNLILKIDDKEILLNLKGKHNAYNISSVYYIALYLGMYLDDIISMIKLYIPPRMKEYIINDCLIIDDSYNANYESMVNGIEYVNRSNYKNKILVLGDMLELGDEEVIIHKDIGKVIKNTIIDKVYTYGNLSKYIGYTCNKISFHYNDKENLINDLKHELDKDTVIYIKGSHSMKLNYIIDRLLLFDK